jgi:hypothetical protein
VIDSNNAIDESIEEYKNMSVTKGLSQKEGLDLGSTFSLIVRVLRCKGETPMFVDWKALYGLRHTS